MIIRIGIEYVSKAVVRVTTPFKQRTISIPQDELSYWLDIRNLRLSEKDSEDSDVVLFWDDKLEAVFVDDYHSPAIPMPTECTAMIIKTKLE
jgi:hypothetical protein